MKETSFINQNKDKWRKFENAYKTNNHNPDELSNLFVEITEDLSYARTHYPKRTVRVYLNNLAQDVFTSLYRIRNKPFSRFVHFWTTSLPIEAWRLRKDMLVALLIFLVSCFIGVISTANDIEYTKVILGSDYVEMTDKHINDWILEQENIKANAKPGSPEYETIKNGGFTGSPLKVYESMDAWPMFSYIFFNNIKVSFYMFVLGLTLGIGTLFMTMQNGIMLGTFQSYFYYKGILLGKNLLYASFLTIWIHGAFEISAIVIAGACGFALARSIMFPGTMTRLQSLQAGAKRGLKVFIGLAVFIFFAAILESWVTRQYNMPEWEKLVIILGSFIIIVTVFVFIPFIVARKHKEQLAVEDNPTYVPAVSFNLYAIRNTADLMTDTFRLYRRHYATTFKSLYKFILPVTFVFLYFNYSIENANYYNDESPWYINVCMVFGSAPYHWIMPAIFWPCITGIFLAHVFYHLQKKEDPDFGNKRYWPFMLARSLEIAILFAPISLIYQYGHPAFMVLVMFIFPLYLPALFSMAHGTGNFFQRMGHGMSVGASGYGSGIAIYFFILLLSAIFLGLFTFQVYWITEEFIKWHIETRFQNYQVILQMIKSCFFVIFYYHMIKLVTLGFTLLYYHVLETTSSKGLFARLTNFGKHNKYYESNVED